MYPFSCKIPLCLLKSILSYVKKFQIPPEEKHLTIISLLWKGVTLYNFLSFCLHYYTVWRANAPVDLWDQNRSQGVWKSTKIVLFYLRIYNFSLGKYKFYQVLRGVHDSSEIQNYHFSHCSINVFVYFEVDICDYLSDHPSSLFSGKATFLFEDPFSTIYHACNCFPFGESQYYLLLKRI